MIVCPSPKCGSPNVADLPHYWRSLPSDSDLKAKYAPPAAAKGGALGALGALVVGIVVAANGAILLGLLIAAGGLGWGEEFYLLVDGERIGGTYWCPPGQNVEAGKQWVSYGPAGYSFGHATREDAEQSQLASAGVAAAPVATVDVPAPPEPKPLAVTWEEALAEAKEKGVSRCSDPALMASFCDGAIQYAVGAVSPQLVWEGAQRRGMSAKELGRLCGSDAMAVSDLMW